MRRNRARRVTRRTVLAATSLFLAGCLGDDGQTGNEDPDGDGGTDSSSNPVSGEVSQQGSLDLTSPAFEDGEPIPERFGYDQENVNPPLSIRSVPEGAVTLALVVDDPDAVEPAGQVWDHWIVWNVPRDVSEIPAGWSPDEPEEGTNDFGEVGYGGPSPPDETHRYRFKCFAVDRTLELSPETDAEALGDAIAGQVLAATQLDGTFSP